MKVSDIMSRDVVTAKLEDDVKKVASVICFKKISGIPVVNDEEIPIGMISEKDLLRAIYPSYQAFFDNPEEFRVFADLKRKYGETTCLKVSQIYNKRVIKVGPDTPLFQALSIMVTKRVRRLPVVNNEGVIIGIVSQGDIHQALFNEQFLLKENT